jgi:peroxiredoxin
MNVILRLGLGWISLFWATQAFAIKVGEIMPKVALKSMGGGTLANEGFANRVTVINVWATWCAACKIELREMESALMPFLGNDKLQVVFVSLDKDPEKARRWFSENIKSKTLRQFLYKDPEFLVAEALKADSFPITVVIDKDGRVSHVQRGFKQGEGSTELIFEKVRAQLTRL